MHERALFIPDGPGLVLNPASALSAAVDDVLARHLPRHPIHASRSLAHSATTCPSATTHRLLDPAGLRTHAASLAPCPACLTGPAAALRELAADVTTGTVTEEHLLFGRPPARRRTRHFGDLHNASPPPRASCCPKAPPPSADPVRRDVDRVVHRVRHARVLHDAPGTTGADTLLVLPNLTGFLEVTLPTAADLVRIGPWAASPTLWIFHLPHAIAHAAASALHGSVHDPALVDAASWHVLARLAADLPGAERTLLDAAHEVRAAFPQLAATAWAATH